MAQSLSSLSNIIPLTKSSNSGNKFYGHPFYCCYYPKGCENGLTSKRNVASVKAEKRDNLDHLQRPSLKRRDSVSSAPLGLWDRFPTARTVQQMMDTMDRIMDDPTAFSTRWQPPLPNNTNGYARGRTPWEIKEGEAEYKMRFDMPGMTKEDVKIWVEESMLVIKAEKVPKRKDNGQENNAVVVEDEEDWPAKSYGKYSTRIALPENVEYEKIKAEVKDGVLYVTIPKPVKRSKVYGINVE